MGRRTRIRLDAERGRAVLLTCRSVSSPPQDRLDQHGSDRLAVDDVGIEAMLAVHHHSLLAATAFKPAADLGLKAGQHQHPGRLPGVEVIDQPEVGGIVALDRPPFADPQVPTVCFRPAWQTAVPGQKPSGPEPAPMLALDDSEHQSMPVFR